MFDVELIESGNGGDLVKQGADLALVFGWQNMPYLAMFGHRGGVTKTEYTPNEFRKDWWGNALLFPNSPAEQINSLTEDALHEIPLTSAGRLQIEEAIKADLQFMQPFAKITVETAITGPKKLNINILIQEPDNLQQKEFLFIWDGLKQQLLKKGGYTAPPPSFFSSGFQYTLEKFF